MNPTDAAVAVPPGGWLSTMPRSARKRLLELMHRVTYPAGSDLVREGQRADELGIVLAGRVAMQLTVPERGRITVQTAEPGDVFTLSAIVPPHRASMTATTLEETEALMIGADDLRSAFADDCELTAAVYYAVARELQRRLAAVQETVLDLLPPPEPALF
jgi:CRP-like cAMP-binding protein